MNATAKKYLSYLNPLELSKTKKVLKVNPIKEPQRDHFKESQFHLYNYNQDSMSNHQPLNVSELEKVILPNNVYWLNVDIVKPKTIEAIASIFEIHPLIQEDILGINQRPKMDEINDQIFCVLQMMYYNDTDNSIESEQVSFVLGSKYLISFQDDESRDHFNGTRDKLCLSNSKIRHQDADYLLYSLLDNIVDNYYIVMEKLGESIEQLEERISKGITDNYTMNSINSLRKEMIIYRRNIVPVRDLLASILRTDNLLIKETNKKYFKDVQDHIVQAVDLSENYRDVVNSIRDLYLNQINLKANEVMKFLAIVTTLLAPATVIGGIFGMNFDKIPYLHNSNGFALAVSLMLVIPLLMLWWFRKKGWY
jgi:magnesium transporter